MEKNIILAGVGGQGILSIAFVIDNAALNAGFHFKQAEVHGMAQRGGAVQSNLRYSDREIFSDIIPSGRADIILSIEPLATTRSTISSWPSSRPLTRSSWSTRPGSRRPPGISGPRTW